MSISLLLLAIWLLLTGLGAFVSLNFPSRDKVMGAIAILAAIFLLIERF